MTTPTPTPTPTPTAAPQGAFYQYVVWRTIKSPDGDYVTDFTYAHDARSPKEVIQAFLEGREAAFKGKEQRTSFFKLDSGAWPYSSIESLAEVSPVEIAILEERASKTALRLAQAQAIREGKLELNEDGTVPDLDQDGSDDEDDDEEEPEGAGAGFMGGLAAGGR